MERVARRRILAEAESLNSLVLYFLFATGMSPAQGLGWEALQVQGARISSIQIDLQDVFDLSRPEEDTFLGRWGNRLHSSTREGVIRETLLFHEGDTVNSRRIHESERYLRALPFLKDARIDPEMMEDGTVRAHVWARDAWTLKVSVNYKLVGGQHTSGFGLQEQNLLGTGKTLITSYVKDPVRTTETLAYVDPHVFGSTWTLLTSYQNLSDGSTRTFRLLRPFVSLDTPWTATVQSGSTSSTLTLYDHGTGIYAAPSQLDNWTLGAAWAAHHTELEAWRPGVVLVDREARYGNLSSLADPGGIAPPALSPRRLRGPGLTLSYLEDGFRAFRDMLAMDTTEDYNLGMAGSLITGSYLPGWNSTEKAPFLQAQWTLGWSHSSQDLVLASASASGRKGPSGWEDALADLTLTGYWKEPFGLITAVHCFFDSARRPDPEDIFYLGGNEGLRGYPNYLHPGDSRWLCSAEQRLLTQERWLGIVRMGFVAFTDAGSIHRTDGEGWSRTYADVGVGLRMGDLKSSLGRVIVIAVAKPLVREPGVSRWQLTFGNIVQF
jgi:Omp85 superfamily domain